MSEASGKQERASGGNLVEEQLQVQDEHRFYTVDRADAPASPHVKVHGYAQLSREPGMSGRTWLALAIVALIVAASLAVFGILNRKHVSAKLADYTNATAAPSVSLQVPPQRKQEQEIVLPGNIEAYAQAPIYARTTGYVKAWYKDIGAHVRKGDLLAVVETPEVDQQLSAAKADLMTAQANAQLAKITADRYKDLIDKDAVSQQDTDTATQQYAARNTEVLSAQANVQRLQELQSFERIEAPFDGVVTARNVDIGQLITSQGSTTTAGGGIVSTSKEMFDVADVRTLRVFVNVPQIYAPDARNGVKASLMLPQYPGRTFDGRLVRSANAFDPATRMLLAEVDVDNRSGELLPGGYAEVHLQVSNPQPALIVPASALILEHDGLHVATVDGQSRAHLIRIVPGRDLGTAIEVWSGLQPGQAVITNPPDSLVDDERVRVVTSTRRPGATR